VSNTELAQTLALEEERAFGAALARRQTLGRVATWLGPAILVLVSVMAIFPGQLARFPPEAANPNRILLPPNSQNWLGTDVNGLDIFSRIVWAARIDLTIAVVSTLLGVTIGTVIGTWAGYYAGRRRVGWLIDLFLRGLDVIQAFPVFVLALALVAVLGRHVFNIIYVLVALEVPIFVRLARSAVLRTREEVYVDAARCAGNSEFRIVFRHILPNSLTPSLVNASVVSGMAILLAAGLSFVGAGVPAPTAEWGYMVAVGADTLITGQWWPALFPGITIGIVVLGFALTGDAIRSHLDPSSR
jgi:peptide/nickel transport system permease protein